MIPLRITINVMQINSIVVRYVRVNVGTGLNLQRIRPKADLDLVAAHVVIIIEQMSKEKWVDGIDWIVYKMKSE